jgi:hypothetical protein
MTPTKTEPSIVTGTVDRRSERRRRSLKGARLFFNHGYGAFECLVRNQSGRGAKLVFGDAAAVPGQFELLIAGEPEPKHAQVRWRSAGEIGILFKEDAVKPA